MSDHYNPAAAVITDLVDELYKAICENYEDCPERIRKSINRYFSKIGEGRDDLWDLTYVQGVDWS